MQHAPRLFPFSRLCLALCALFWLSACDLSGDPNPDPVVVGGPTIIDFNASPLEGGSATLSWRVSEATSLSLDQGVGDVTGESSVGVSPAVTTTYTLSATNDEGTDQASVTVTVSDSGDPGSPNENVAPTVTIEEVEAVTLEDGSASVSLDATVEDPDSEAFTYTWNVTEGEAENVTLQSRNSEDTDVSFLAAGTYTLTLTVSDGDKEGAASIDVEVKEGEDNPGEPDTPSGGTIEVTSTSGAASLEDKCTLRAAITAANTDEAVGGCEAGSGADTIVLAEDAIYTLTEIDNGAEDSTAGPNGLPRVTSEIRLEGNNATVERLDAEDAPLFRLFYVGETGKLSLENATIRRGTLEDNAEGDDLEVYGSNFANFGTLTLVDMVVSEGNSALGFDTGGDYAASIYNAGVLTLLRSELRDNSGVFDIQNLGEASLTESTVRNIDGPGGAIYNGEAGDLTLVKSNVTGHATFGVTAGVDNEGQARIIESVIANNVSDQGDGGIYNAGTGEMEIERSLITANSAGDGGTGGIFNDGKLTLLNSTVSGNSSEFEFSGSAIRNEDGGTVDVRYSTIKNNKTGDDDPDDSLFANAIINDGTITFRGVILENNGLNCVGTFTSEGYNLSSDGSCALDQDTDRSNANPQLGPLQDNGGPTQTHALEASSPALDAVPTDVCTVSTDQRGVSRPQGEACDIGAFERE